MSNNYWDVILASSPVNSQAAKAVSRGDHYEPKFVSSATFWEECPELASIEHLMQTQPQFIDLTGKSVGRMTIVGIYANDPPSRAKKTKGALWVCRCVCGRYQGVRGKRIKEKTTQKCDYCINVEMLREGREWPSRSKDNRPENNNNEQGE